MLHWYLIYTKPAGETTALVNLQRQGYDIYFPRLALSVVHRGRPCERIVALFPRYLFLRLHESHQSLGPVRSTLGVAGVVRFGFDYTIVPEAVIEHLRARADPTGLHRCRPPPRLAPGDSVKITGTPFDGLEGVFECEVGADRVVRLLNFLGRDVSVRVPARRVRPNHAA